MAPPSSAYTEAAKHEIQPRLLPQIKGIRGGQTDLACQGPFHGLLALQLLGLCLSQAGHLDTITLYVLVSSRQHLQAILTEREDLSNLQKEG